MASIDRNRPVQYRAKAQEAREKAAAAPDEATRKRLLNDVDLWDRIADYEDRIPSENFRSHYPRD